MHCTSRQGSWGEGKWVLAAKNLHLTGSGCGQLVEHNANRMHCANLCVATTWTLPPSLFDLWHIVLPVSCTYFEFCLRFCFMFYLITSCSCFSFSLSIIIIIIFCFVPQNLLQLLRDGFACFPVELLLLPRINCCGRVQGGEGVRLSF